MYIQNLCSSKIIGAFYVSHSYLFCITTFATRSKCNHWRNLCKFCNYKALFSSFQRVAVFKMFCYYSGSPSCSTECKDLVACHGFNNTSFKLQDNTYNLQVYEQPRCKGNFSVHVINSTCFTIGDVSFKEVHTNYGIKPEVNLLLVILTLVVCIFTAKR